MMNPFDPFERLPLRGVFPALRPYVSNYEWSRWIYWLFATCVVMVVLTALAWAIDRILKWKGLQ